MRDGNKNASHLGQRSEEYMEGWFDEVDDRVMKNSIRHRLDTNLTAEERCSTGGNKRQQRLL